MLHKLTLKIFTVMLHSTNESCYMHVSHDLHVSPSIQLSCLLKQVVYYTFQVCEWNLFYVTIQVKAIEQYFHVVLFIMLYKMVLTF